MRITYIEFAGLLRHHLKMRNLTQRWLAQKLNVSYSTVSNWIRGVRRPSFQLVQGMTQLLELTPGQRIELHLAAGFSDLLKEPFYIIDKDEIKESSHLRHFIDEYKVDEDKIDEYLNKEAPKESPHLRHDIDEDESKNEIKRSINFPPQYKQAGISILSYFSDVIAQKYPSLEVGVTIEQVGTTVSLVITTPEGEKERIEKELTTYSLVIQGKIAPEDYLNHPVEIMALQNKLEIAALELRQNQRLLETERRHYDARLGSLEQQVQWMGSLVEKDRTAHVELMKAFQDLSRQTTATTKHSFNTILEVLDRGISIEDKESIVEALRNIQRQDKSLFSQVSELITVGAIQGIAGNYLYQFLLNLSFKL